MATLAQEQTINEELQTLLNELVAIKPEDLVRADVLGRDLSFESGRAVFERTLKLFRDLHECNLDNVAYNTLVTLRDRSKETTTRFASIKDFSVSKYPNNAVAQRDSFITAIRDGYDGCYAHVSPVIAYSIRKGTDFENLEKQAAEIVRALEVAKEESATKQKHALVEMDSTLEKVRRAAAEVGVSQHATHFKDQSDEHARLSERWLAATIVMTIVAVAWGAATFWIHADGVGTNPPSAGAVLQVTFSKLIVLSGLYYGLVLCGRSYSAHRHNHVVNKHRQNALSSFETFAKAAGDDADIKNAVLLQATQSIFASQMSGYSEKDNDGEAPNKIIEILRSVNASAGPKP